MPELLAPLAFCIYTSVFQDVKSLEVLKLQNRQWKSNSPKTFCQCHRRRNMTRGMTQTFVSYVCTTYKPWHIAQHINQQRTTGAADCCNGTECRLHEMAKKTIKSRCNNQSQWSSKGGAPANVECEVQGSLGACHALHKRQRKIP